MKANRSSEEGQATNPVDVPVPAGKDSLLLGHAGTLAMRISVHEQEKIELQKLLCELLLKNEELRRQVAALNEQSAVAYRDGELKMQQASIPSTVWYQSNLNSGTALDCAEGLTAAATAVTVMRRAKYIL